MENRIVADGVEWCESDEIGIPIRANLSSCHPSYPDGNSSCCPPWPAQEPVDFQFPHPSSPIRVRRPVHLVDDEYKAKYERAVAIMKQLPLDHPHNFWRQADLHCLYCTGAYSQFNYSTEFRIHHSWLFFPWHRALLYFHERILGKLIGDDSFALLYWNWDHPDGMRFPAMFTEGALDDTERDSMDIQNVVDHNFHGTDRGLSDREQILENLALMYNQMVSSPKQPELFMGCKLRSGDEGKCKGTGTIESAPHNTVHRWVGSRDNPVRENMGAFYSSGFDPVFYSHHSNIDRLWALWQRMRDNELEFDDEMWLNSEFTFYDENLQFVRIRVRDVLSISKLRYGYQDIELPWLDARPKPSVPPEIARSILRKREGALQTPGGAPQGNWTLDKTLTVRIQRPRINRTREEKRREEEILFVYGIGAAGTSAGFVKFDVFVNAVEELTVLSPRSREFAGTFSHIHDSPRLYPEEGGGRDKKKVKPHLKLGISELLEDLQADEDDSIWVMLVPRGGTATVQGIRIDYMK
ncbi:hypothetical protein Cni_G11663 [Canna indica]|uniref:Tyrosinase copper-binding domain-containing protein n=1 Tax=Canna indica TaxID=4628 RepID=A0AAQ3K867_9LILI|nr:hypothetical protein Cni_G11663 [Canna indica]